MFISIRITKIQLGHAKRRLLRRRSVGSGSYQFRVRCIQVPVAQVKTGIADASVAVRRALSGSTDSSWFRLGAPKTTSLDDRIERTIPKLQFICIKTVLIRIKSVPPSMCFFVEKAGRRNIRADWLLLRRSIRRTPKKQSMVAFRRIDCPEATFILFYCRIATIEHGVNK